MMFSHVLVVASLAFLGAEAFSTGAPNGGVCKTLIPKHETNQQQSGPSPYSLWVDSGRVKSSPSGSLGTPATIKVELKHNSGSSNKFKGFLIQARSAENPDVITGTFIPTDHSNSQAIDCEGGKANSLTHANPSSKSSVSGLWMPDADFKGKVILTATVVEKFDTFWTNFKSLPITVE